MALLCIILAGQVLHAVVSVYPPVCLLPLYLLNRLTSEFARMHRSSCMGLKFEVMGRGQRSRPTYMCYISIFGGVLSIDWWPRHRCMRVMGNRMRWLAVGGAAVQLEWAWRANTVGRPSICIEGSPSGVMSAVNHAMRFVGQFLHCTNVSPYINTV